MSAVIIYPEMNLCKDLFQGHGMPLQCTPRVIHFCSLLCIHLTLNNIPWEEICWCHIWRAWWPLSGTPPFSHCTRKSLI